MSEPKFIKTPFGCEAYSNDGKIKYILRQVVIHAGNSTKMAYSATVFFREERQWMRSCDANSYSTEEEFLRTIRTIDEFSEAAREIREIMRKT